MIATAGPGGFGLAAGIWTVRRRIPDAALHAVIVLVVLMTAVIVAQAKTYAGAVVTAFPYVWIALYVALFFSRRAAFAHAALISATFGIGLLAGGLPHVLTGWLVVSITVAVAALALSSVNAQLRSQAEYLRAVMTSAADGIITLTPDGRGSFVNPSAARMLGYEPDELQGRELAGVIVREGIGEDASPLAGDEVFVRKDGTSFPVLFSRTPLRLQGGSGGVVLTFTDISERRRVEQMKDEFVSV